jgi:hypothetical protein
MEKLIKLNHDDNVYIVRSSIFENENIVIDSQIYSYSQQLGIGHKIASENIKRGEHVIKYGVSIGSASVDITKGEHVHLHNLKSDYIPTYTLENQMPSH